MAKKTEAAVQAKGADGSSGGTASNVQAIMSNKVAFKFNELRTRLFGAFAERKETIDAMLCALLAGEHCVMLGPPGTGKSALARAVCSAFTGSSYFETLLTRYSEPSDLFGGVDLPKWTSTGVYERRSAGMLQEAQIAFLTEVFKGNASVLNALLTAMNERVFFDGGKRVAMPLQSLFGDSNEMPESAELGAMWDRFLVRLHVQYVREEPSFSAVLTGADPSVCAAGLLQLQELYAAKAQVAAVPLAADVVPGMYALRNALMAEGIVVSDRRWKQCLGLLRAWAWLNGDTTVDVLHFEVLKHALWTDPREVQKVTTLVTKTASPLLNDATEAFDAIMEQVDALPPEGSVKNQGASVAAEMKKAMAKLDEIKKQASLAVAGRIEPMMDTLKDKHSALVKRITTELGL